MIDFDNVLPHIGEYGRYQILMLALLAPIANIPCGFTYMSIVFISATPDHWCKVPQLEALGNLSTSTIKSMTIPTEEREGTVKLSNCKMYDRNYTQIANEILMGYQPTLNESEQIVDCMYGWNYDRSTYDETLVTEMDVVCGNRWMQSMAESSFFIGTIIGSIVFGNLGNRFGRKATFYVLLSFNILSGIIASFPPNYLAYIVYRGLFGTTSIVMFQIPFILAMEMMSPAKRSISGMFICTAFPFSILLTTGLAALVRNWFYLSLITSAPLTIFLFVWYFVPESPRWLLTRNRIDEAEEIVQKIARINKKKIPPNFLRDFMRKASLNEEGNVKPSSELAIVQMVKYPNIRKKFFIISFGWIVNAVVYVGLLLGATMFGINHYLSVTVSGLMELPGVVVAWWLMDIFGRRWVIFTSMVLGGISCFCAGFTPAGWTTLILANIGKLGISASYSVIYVFGSELFPTVLRTLALATASLVGSIGAITAPYILYLETMYGKAVPVIILGMLSVAGGISTLFLPETLNENLPETLQEGEEFGKNAKFWSCPWTGKTKHVRSASIVSTTQADYKMHGVMNLGKF